MVHLYVRIGICTYKCVSQVHFTLLKLKQVWWVLWALHVYCFKYIESQRVPATLVLKSLIIRFCYYYYYCYDYCYSTTSSMHGLLLPFDHLSLPVICPSVCCHTSDSTTTTTQQQQQQEIADRLDVTIAATVVDSLQATTVSLLLARLNGL